MAEGGHHSLAAGDDQADTGSKTFEREQEISLANSILERIKQVEHRLLPACVRALCQGRLEVDGRHVRIREEGPE
jgi:folate-dependent phosphoribosylglycinamide formyltransferase PurN